MIDVPITIHEAKFLMDVLENDIPYWERDKIALLLLILSANPSLAEKQIELVGYSSRTIQRSYLWDDSMYGDYCD